MRRVVLDQVRHSGADASEVLLQSTGDTSADSASPRTRLKASTAIVGTGMGVVYADCLAAYLMEERAPSQATAVGLGLIAAGCLIAALRGREHGSTELAEHERADSLSHDIADLIGRVDFSTLNRRRFATVELMQSMQAGETTEDEAVLAMHDIHTKAAEDEYLSTIRGY